MTLTWNWWPDLSLKKEPVVISRIKKKTFLEKIKEQEESKKFQSHKIYISVWDRNDKKGGGIKWQGVLSLDQQFFFPATFASARAIDKLALEKIVKECGEFIKTSTLIEKYTGKEPAAEFVAHDEPILKSEELIKNGH